MCRSKQDIQSRHEQHLAQMRDWENGKSSRESELQRLQQEHDGHANAVRDAEAALAAARDRHHHSYSRFTSLQ